MAVSKLSEEFTSEFQQLLQSKGFAANEHLQSLVACLRKHNYIYTIQIHPQFFLTHKANRGGLLLSPHNVHRNAGRIQACGADMKQLTNALCMELPASGPVREDHLAKNRTLIQRAAGLLAAINGLERYVTLGCGHTTAFCKQAHAGGRTSEKSLQHVGSEDIDLQKLYSNTNFKAMVTEGWAWEVVHAIVDEEFPAFASVAQKALNTQNHISTEVGELETCMTLASNADDPGMRELPGWELLAVENVRSLCVPCGAYADTLLSFVVTYGGGSGAPLVAFMDNVAKQFGCNVSLGQSYWQALTNTIFPSKTCLYPLLRISLGLANMTGDKLEDNVARLLVKSDVLKIAHKSKMAVVDEIETALQNAMAIAISLGGADVCLKPLGQMFVRMGLKATDKEKGGRERKCYTIQEICSIFLKDVSECIGHEVTFVEWGKAPNKADDKPYTAPPKPVVASMSDHRDPVWIAAQSGFSIGQIIAHKSSDNIDPERMYTIFSIDASVQLHQVCSYTHQPLKATITLLELLEDWSLCKSEAPVMMQGGQSRPMTLNIDKQKGILFKAVVELDAKHVDKHALAFWRKPDEVRTLGSTIKKGMLVLVPVAGLVSFSTNNAMNRAGISMGRHDTGGKLVEFFILPVAKTHNLPRDSDIERIVAAYWWVAASTTDDKKVANMEVDHVSQGGIDVPVLRNLCDLAPWTRLCVFAPKVQAKAVHWPPQADAQWPPGCGPKAKAAANARAGGLAKANAASKRKRAE